MLDEAKRLTGNEAFVPRWMSGVVRAQLPGFIGEGDNALSDLAWCETHAASAPHPGWLREVYFQRAALLRARGDSDDAKRYQSLSGLPEGAKSVLFSTPFSEDPTSGHAFSAKAIREIVPGSVYVVSGFEFTEYYFVVSSDKRELIAIDAGTRTDSARAATEALRAKVPSLPPLTTVLVTHAHWDHVGGHKYFESLTPRPRFIGRANFAGEIERDAMAQVPGLKQFFGAEFSLADVLSYHPDVTIDRPTELTIGGTKFELLPTRGGETDDALLIQMPEQGVLFVGDVMMPYLGAPFANEGSVDGMISAIDQIHDLKPTYLLHGHEPLTRTFSTTAMLDQLRPQLVWLKDQVLQAIRDGKERAAIQSMNLIPPHLERSNSDVHLAYLLLRENVINRLFAQNSGYWRNGLDGLDALSDRDIGQALADYLGASDSQIAAAAERMIADGKIELAARMLRWGQAKFPDSEKLSAARQLAYLKLADKYQQFNPFKFIIYSNQIHYPIQQIAPSAATPAMAKR